MANTQIHQTRFKATYLGEVIGWYDTAEEAERAIENAEAAAENMERKMRNDHNLAKSKFDAIEALDETQLKAVRNNIDGREYDDNETREAVAQYVADGGEIKDLLS